MPGRSDARYILRALFGRAPVVSRKGGRVAIETQWVVDDAHLARLCAEWRQLPFVAVDTEFMRVDTFYPIAGLVQVGDGRRAYLIDPLAVRDWHPFATLLTMLLW